MGEARRRRLNGVPTVYHHTSTLRTNLIWMSGVVQVEGKSEGVLHPQLGEIKTDALVRRSLIDFPPVAWFTTRIDVPRCLISTRISFVRKGTGEIATMDLDAEIANAMALNRVALGFRIADVPVVPWSEYHGYKTEEGQELNASAREAGDDPDDWYFSEEPVDVMKVSEFWGSRSMLKPKLRRFDAYIQDIRRMVSMCREQKGAYIPPSWLKPEQAVKLAEDLNLRVWSPGG